MCLSDVIIVSVATEVAASCNDVFSVIQDIESMPSVLTPTVGVERLSKGTEFELGTRWKEVRTYNGFEIEQCKTVTSLRKEAGGYSVAINVTYPGELKEFTNTSTLEIRPSSGNNEKSLLIGSFGVMPGGLLHRIRFCLFNRKIRKEGQRSFLVELEEIGKAAVGRSQQE